MQSLVSNDYNRRFLNDVIKRNALEMVITAKNAARTKDITNRTFHLRANSVANTMSKREMHKAAEETLKFGGGGNQRKQMIIDLSTGRGSMTTKVSPKADDLRAKLGIQSMLNNKGDMNVQVPQIQGWNTPENDKKKDLESLDAVTDVGGKTGDKVF